MFFLLVWCIAYVIFCFAYSYLRFPPNGLAAVSFALIFELFCSLATRARAAGPNLGGSIFIPCFWIPVNRKERLEEVEITEAVLDLEFCWGVGAS